MNSRDSITLLLLRGTSWWGRGVVGCLVSVATVCGEVEDGGWGGDGRYAIMGMGAVCHTLNPRLFVDQLIYIAHHGQRASLAHTAPNP